MLLQHGRFLQQLDHFAPNQFVKLTNGKATLVLARTDSAILGMGPPGIPTHIALALGFGEHGLLATLTGQQSTKEIVALRPPSRQVTVALEALLRQLKDLVIEDLGRREWYPFFLGPLTLTTLEILSVSPAPVLRFDSFDLVCVARADVQGVPHHTPDIGPAPSPSSYGRDGCIP